MLADSEINQIKNRIPISSLVSRYVNIVEKGSKKWCVCPFHDDKNPSMIVDDDRQNFHCFGCGESGDIFAFLMKYEHLSFPEALAKLAAEAGVDIKKNLDEENVYQFRIRICERPILEKIYNITYKSPTNMNH